MCSPWSSVLKTAREAHCAFFLTVVGPPYVVVGGSCLSHTQHTQRDRMTSSLSILPFLFCLSLSVFRFRGREESMLSTASLRVGWPHAGGLTPVGSHGRPTALTEESRGRSYEDRWRDAQVRSKVASPLKQAIVILSLLLEVSRRGAVTGLYLLPSVAPALVTFFFRQLPLCVSSFFLLGASCSSLLFLASSFSLLFPLSTFDALSSRSRLGRERAGPCSACQRVSQALPRHLELCRQRAILAEPCCSFTRIQVLLGVRRKFLHSALCKLLSTVVFTGLPVVN